MNIPMDRRMTDTCIGDSAWTNLLRKSGDDVSPFCTNRSIALQDGMYLLTTLGYALLRSYFCSTPYYTALFLQLGQLWYWTIAPRADKLMHKP